MGFGDRSTGRGTFGGEFGERRCNQWGLTFAATRPCSQITLGRRVLVRQVWTPVTDRYQIKLCVSVGLASLRPRRARPVDGRSF